MAQLNKTNFNSLICLITFFIFFSLTSCSENESLSDLLEVPVENLPDDNEDGDEEQDGDGGSDGDQGGDGGQNDESKNSLENLGIGLQFSENTDNDKRSLLEFNPLAHVRISFSEEVSGELIFYSSNNCDEDSVFQTFPLVEAEDFQGELDFSSLGAGEHFFSARLTNDEEQSPCSSDYLSLQLLNCPDGYVPGVRNPLFNSDLPQLKPFCVMKYEAKIEQADGEIHPSGCKNESCGATWTEGEVDSFKAVSTPLGRPWVRIRHNHAFSACNRLNDFSEDHPTLPDAIEGGFSLISNDEWMALARDLANQAENWTGHLVGSGCLKRGNAYGGAASAGDTGVPCTNHDETILDSAYGMLASDGGIGRNPLAELFLSHGESLWDLAGNAWEFINWKNSFDTLYGLDPDDRAYVCDEVNCSLVNDFQEFKDINRNHSIDSEMPPSTWAPIALNGENELFLDSRLGAGQYFSSDRSPPRHYALRGGTFHTENSVGPFALIFESSGTNTAASWGFRCVYRLK